MFLVPGWLVPGGGGGRATSSQSSEPGGGKSALVTVGGGRSLCGDTGVGSTLSSSVSSPDLPIDTDAIERVIRLETESALSGPTRVPKNKHTLIRINAGLPIVDIHL